MARRDWLKASVSLLCACVFLSSSICVYFVSKGFHRVEPQSALRQAQQNWLDGRIIQSIPQFGTAIGMAIEGELRWSMAIIHVEKMHAWERRGQLEKALAECAIAVRWVRGYDTEGALSYACTMIEEQIKRPSLPAPTPSPQP